jgi:hypothetical protein
MRRLLLALPFALLPLTIAQAGAAAQEVEHASLGAHEHGTARLNAALDDETLELELDSPAMNLVGFEHPATSDADKTTVSNVRHLLEHPLTLFAVPASAKCIVAKQTLNSPLFGDKPDADEHDHDEDADEDAVDGAEHHHDHSEIHARYQFQCDNAAALKTLDLTQLFKTFPATHKVQVQLIAPNGQEGVDATPDNSVLTY